MALIPSIFFALKMLFAFMSTAYINCHLGAKSLYVLTKFWTFCTQVYSYSNAFQTRFYHGILISL